jgi:endoglucanase
MPTRLRPAFVAALVLLAITPGAAAAAPRRPAQRGGRALGGTGSVFFSSSVYQANENAGQFAVTVQRTGNLSAAETFYYGVTNVGSEAGNNFDKVPNTKAQFAPGQSTFTFYVTINDQGINGPMRRARAYLFGASPQPLGSPSQAIIDLLQNDPLAARNSSNPLDYPQAPTDGNPLQYVHWYVFGAQAPAALAMRKLGASDAAWGGALQKIAYTPGSGSYRFWMWNQPAATLAATVEKYLADAEQAQPGTTVPLSTYSLVHGACENPSAIRRRFEAWITQLADGIGNFRVVLYLEEDSLMETHCLTHAQIQTRLQELAYAVKALSRDPHALVYMDAGAPDGWSSPRRMAAYLRQADIAQAQGFFVNATHYDWTTSDIHYGQQIARLTGGKHFIVQTDDNGRGPLVPRDRAVNGNEDLCNPPGRGMGPLSWNTGYEYVDGLLWFNNPGNSDGPCGAGDPPIAQFWPAYAVGLVERATNKVTGPHFDLLKSATNQ